MAEALNIFLADDSDHDALLINRALRQSGITPSVERAPPAKAVHETLSREASN